MAQANVHPLFLQRQGNSFTVEALVAPAALLWLRRRVASCGSIPFETRTIFLWRQYDPPRSPLRITPCGTTPTGPLYQNTATLINGAYR